VTAFYGVLQRSTGRLTYVNAGHEHPLLLHPDGTLTSLDSRGRFLGMIEELELPEYTAELRSGHRLLLFSDGVPDAVNRDGHQFGRWRLANLMRAQQNRPARVIVDNIAATLRNWSGGGSQFDDLTFMVVEAK
jgi:sigma-B regulation protein RsbU (phosphoserine phosphatase)